LSKYSATEFDRRINLSQNMFRQIEERLLDFLEYVPMRSRSTKHLDVYSLKLVSIILETGPEIINSFDLASFPTSRRLVNDPYAEDRKKVLAKERRKRETKKSLSFNDYASLLTKSNGLKNAVTEIRGLGAYIMPFERIPPKWWNAYNLLKHDKYNNLEKATLENALKAVGGLYWLIASYSPLINTTPVHFGKVFFSSALFQSRPKDEALSLSLMKI